MWLAEEIFVWVFAWVRLFSFDCTNICKESYESFGIRRKFTVNLNCLWMAIIKLKCYYDQKVHLYSNHPETIIKYFVTNLNKHKHSIRSGHLVYWCRNFTATKSSDELTLKESIYIIIISIIYIIIYIMKKIQQWIKQYSKHRNSA